MYEKRMCENVIEAGLELIQKRKKRRRSERTNSIKKESLKESIFFREFIFLRKKERDEI